MDKMSFVSAAASAAVSAAESAVSAAVSSAASAVASAVGLGSGLGEAQDVAFSFWAAGLADAAGGDSGAGEIAAAVAGLGDLGAQIGEILSPSLLVSAFGVDEAIFGQTRVEVMLVSKRPDIDLEALIDMPATLTVHHKYLPQLRHFSGIVVEAERGDSGHHRTAYRVVLLPSLARLDHGSDCRIFQNVSVPDIVRTVFSEHGIEDVEWRLSGEHDTREYCTQYRETHLGFIERILAEEGIFYYFSHDREGKHTLILSDRPDDLDDCPGGQTLEYNALGSTAIKGVYCSSLNYRKKLRSTTYVQRDYTFKNPVYNQESQDTTSHHVGEKGDYELYDYPGRYKQSAVGKGFTQHKLEATRVDAALAYGQANAPFLLSGHGVMLSDHPDGELNQRWRLLTIRHEGVQPQAFGEDGQGAALAKTGLIAPTLNGVTLAGLSFGLSGSASPGLLNGLLSRGLGLAVQQGGLGEAVQDACLYSCAFTAQAAQLAYRPPQVVKPHVDGPQVAIVVGPEGEQIYTDEHGRVKVHFPWDRHKDPKAEDSSCWIRVSQAWGGGSFGNIAIPRIGQEVIVDYLEGDPDQPIIMGRTYHANNHPPYKLPDHKTKMVIRSDTHKGDGGFNELSFEDEAGSENMFLHAERDQTIKVKNNQTQRIDANALQAIGQNQAIEVGQNVNHQVGGGYNQVIGSVGSAAVGLLGGALSPLMGLSAGQLHDGSNIATEAGGEQGAEMAASAASFANLVGMGGVVSSLAAMASNFDGSRGGVNDAARYDMRTEGGKSMSNAGAGLAGHVASLVGDGVFNQLVAKFQNISTGIAVSEQIGSIKTSAIGHASIEDVGHTKRVTVGNAHYNLVREVKVTSVGKEYKIDVGEAFTISVGKGMATLTMKSDGTVTIYAEKNISFISEDKIEMQAPTNIGMNDGIEGNKGNDGNEG